MDDYSQSAIISATKATLAYCKFITSNDVGLTGGHQYGYFIHKASWPVLFTEKGLRGENKDRKVKICWQDDFETESRFVYYGVGTRNEYRITQFGRDFPYLSEDTLGSLLVLCKLSDDYYKAYVLQTEDEIDNFLEYFALSPLEANGIIEKIETSQDELANLIQQEIAQFGNTFPETVKLAESAREVYSKLSDVTPDYIKNNPDDVISHWIDTEYSLFKALEKVIYHEYLENNFKSVDSLVVTANTILNRRKSRAGKSLEHHLAKIFDIYQLPYSAQKTTEGHKKPDFIMPSIEAYKDNSYSHDKLVFLGAKTTCKDRWRQVLNEAERIPEKHLFTLQPGVSPNQLQEMKDEKLILVVPESNMSFFPEGAQNVITLKRFIDFSVSRI